MADSRVSETPHTTVIESGGSGVGTILIGLALLIAVAVGAWFLIGKDRNDAIRTDAVSSAAKDVGDSANKVGGAAEKAADTSNQ